MLSTARVVEVGHFTRFFSGLHYIISFFQAKLQSLLLKVHQSDSEQPVQSQNGQIDENTEPSSKRRKTSLNMAGESSEETSSTHSGMSSGQNGVVTSFPVLSSELRVFDKNIK